MDRLLSLTERLAVFAAFRAVNETRQQLVAANEQVKQLLVELGLDPAKQYEVSPDGHIRDVSDSERPADRPDGLAQRAVLPA